MAGISPELSTAYNIILDIAGGRKVYNSPTSAGAMRFDKDWDQPAKHWRVHYPDGPGNGTITLPCIGDCVFFTHNGTSGLCPAGTKVGDIIAVFYGGHVPHILWETGIEVRCAFIG